MISYTAAAVSSYYFYCNTMVGEVGIRKCSCIFSAEILVGFTQQVFIGTEESQVALVSLQLAMGSATVPANGLSVAIATSSVGATATG